MNQPPWAGRYSRPYLHRRFAVGDVHGCSATLRRMVEEVLRLTQDDTLYLLGDYIDRGPDSKGVLDYLLHMWDADYDIRPLLGNHEAMLLDAATDGAVRSLWYGNGGWETLREFQVDHPDQIPRRYRDFLSQLPRMLTTNDYVFVHAGLDFSTAHPIEDTSPEYLLWGDASRRPEPDKLEGRTLVHGHFITPLHVIRGAARTKVVPLDNGCFSRGEMSQGALLALDLDTRELLVQPNCEPRR